MNIFELGFAVLTVGGGIIGGVKGFAVYGAFGAIVGAVAGAAMALAVAFAMTFILAAFFSIVTGQPLFKPRRPQR